MVKSVAMEGLRLCLFFLQADPCLVGESLWRVLHISDNWAVSEPRGEPLLFVRSCRIENVLLVNSIVSRSLRLPSSLFKHRL